MLAGIPGLSDIPVVGRLLWIFWLFQQMASRQYVSISYCVCKTHRKGRLIMLTAMIICLLAGVCLIIAAIMNHDGTSAIRSINLSVDPNRNGPWMRSTVT